jgi:hypothetical protein
LLETACDDYELDDDNQDGAEDCTRKEVPELEFTKIIFVENLNFLVDCYSQL